MVAEKRCLAKTLTNEDALRAYNRAKEIDEWPGESYSGSSNQAAAKVMREWGHYESFAWAANPTDMNLWVRSRGPVAFTCQWRQGMYQTDRDGFLWASGDVVGGHLMACIGIDQRGNYVVQNSWSERFGKNGICYITPETMNWLYGQGQWTACSPVEVGVPEPTPDEEYRPEVHRQGLNTFNRERGELLNQEHVLFTGYPGKEVEIGYYRPKHLG